MNERRSVGAGGVDRFIGIVRDRLDGTPLAAMLDVDGTLAPIAPTPEQAGRAAADAWRLAGVDGAWVIGNHGFELRTPDGQLSPLDAVRPFEDRIAEAAHLLSAVEPVVPGAIIENKRWTMSLHYRLVDPDDVGALVERARDVARTLDLRITEGKKIVELRPPVDVDKGTATISLVEHVGALAHDASVLYAGDDRTDEDAIAALRTRTERAVTVHVSGSNDQMAGTRAEVVLDSTEELREVLDLIVARRSHA